MQGECKAAQFKRGVILRWTVDEDRLVPKSLTAVTKPNSRGDLIGGGGRTRTYDLRIMRSKVTADHQPCSCSSNTSPEVKRRIRLAKPAPTDLFVPRFVPQTA